MEVQVLSSALAVLALAVGMIFVPAGGSAETPVPLRGVPLVQPTGLRLLVADKTPFVLDVDSGRVTPVRGIPAIDRGTLEVVGVAGRAAVVIARSGADAKLYAVRGPGAQVAYLGTGTNASPTADGRAVWVHSRVGRSRCALRQVALDGRQLHAPRPFPCTTGSDPPGGAIGVVVNRTRVLDPFTARTVVRTRWGVLAVAGRHLVLAGPGRQFTLLDAETRAERRLPWPSIVAGRDQPAVDSRGRLVALAFADPAWKGTGNQALDVWVLETETGELSQLPGMPAFVSLKLTSMAWSDDGRLVLLAESGGKDVVAVWRPGRRRLAVKTVRLPERADGGSDSFAPLG